MDRDSYSEIRRHIEKIRVVDTHEHLPPENEYEESRGPFGGAIKKLPDWYVEGNPKPPGGRITFTTWKHFDKDSPLLESGLIGPVRLLTAVRYGLA